MWQNKFDFGGPFCRIVQAGLHRQRRPQGADFDGCREKVFEE
jgi:hypothetical protein